MPKIKGSLADVSTDYQLIEPDTYEFKVDEIEVEETKPSKDYPEGQLLYIVISKVDQPGEEAHGRKVYDRIYWYKKAKDGEPGGENEYSKIQLKRYFEAILGEERANEDDLDTDELKGGRFMAEVTIESWENKNTGKSGQSNRLKNISPVE